MLILTRRIGEVLNIGDDVEIMVLGVKGNHVRIGISAPKDVEVHRQEIYERIHGERTGQTTSANQAPPAPSRAAPRRKTLRLAKSSS